MQRILTILTLRLHGSKFTCSRWHFDCSFLSICFLCKFNRFSLTGAAARFLGEQKRGCWQHGRWSQHEYDLGICRACTANAALFWRCVLGCVVLLFFLCSFLLSALLCVAGSVEYQGHCFTVDANIEASVRDYSNMVCPLFRDTQQQLHSHTNNRVLVLPRLCMVSPRGPASPRATRPQAPKFSARRKTQPTTGDGRYARVCLWLLFV